MLMTASSNGFVDQILELVSRVLQLRPEHEALAHKEYGEVAAWLATPGNPLERRKSDVYPQGSLRIGTTLPPLGRNEFDLDIVCQMLGHRDESPDHVYGLVWRRLAEHPPYARMLEAKNRCSRLNSSGPFHLDVLPCIADDELGGTAILIPDRERKQWVSGNPRGFAAWFELKAVPRVDTVIRGHVEPLKIQPAGSKVTLQRSVQLMKRARDVAFKDAADMAPVSIVLTTLAGHFYGAEMLCFDAMTSIVDRICMETERREILRVVNPVNPRENLSERWQKDPKAYGAFVMWIRTFRDQLHRLHDARGVAAIELLKQMFGDHAVADAYRRVMAPVEAARQSGNLRVTTASGRLAAAAAAPASMAVARNTFYGD